MGLQDDLTGVQASDPTAGYVGDPTDDYQGGEQAGEDPARVGGQTVPNFYHYIFHFDSGKGAESGKKKTKLARIGGNVKAGPPDTEGLPVYDDLYLQVSKTAKVDGVDVPKETMPADDPTKFPNKLLEDRAAFQKRLNKIARVGKFPSAFPTAATVQAADAYAKQFEMNGGFDAIITIRESAETFLPDGATSPVTRIRNRFVWESLRAPDDPPTKAGLKKGYKTALEEAEAHIAEAAKIAAAKTPAAQGRTAGGVGKRSTLAE